MKKTRDTHGASCFAVLSRREIVVECWKWKNNHEKDKNHSVNPFQFHTDDNSANETEQDETHGECRDALYGIALLKIFHQFLLVAIGLASA